MGAGCVCNILGCCYELLCRLLRYRTATGTTRLQTPPRALGLRPKRKEYQMSSVVPENLGKCNVISEIDRGSMGTVYLGHNLYIDRQVAIKVAHPEQLNDEKGGDRFRKMFFNGPSNIGSNCLAKSSI